MSAGIIEKRELAGGMATLELSQQQLAQAVEFWLQTKIFRFPVKVAYIEKASEPYRYGFRVDIVERDNDDG